MKNVLPKKVRVLTRWYKVQRDDSIDAMGKCDWNKGIITINVGFHELPCQVTRTLWHEIGHAYSWESGLHSTKLTMDAEEFFCETFSALICDLTGGTIRQRR